MFQKQEAGLFGDCDCYFSRFRDFDPLTGGVTHTRLKDIMSAGLSELKSIYNPVREQLALTVEDATLFPFLLELQVFEGRFDAGEVFELLHVF